MRNQTVWMSDKRLVRESRMCRVLLQITRWTVVTFAEIGTQG